MTPATWWRDDPSATRLLAVGPRGELHSATVGALADFLRAGDLVVVNDAATLPASLHGTTARGAQVEVRLAGNEEHGAFRAVLFGAGDWHTRTEHRPPPPAVHTGETLQLDGLTATVASIDAHSPRLLTLRFGLEGAELWRALYRAGRPVQYAHAAREFPLWNVQTFYAARPWAAEAPSAGFPLTWSLALALRRAGVGLTRVTHAAGLSSTGDPALDARLPLAERFEVTPAAVRAVELAHARGGRVIAIGTTVARALESAASGGALRPASGLTELLLGPGRPLRVVDGILTGVHEADTSHFRLLEAFAPRPVLERALERAEAEGFLGHELGDAMLVLRA